MTKRTKILIAILIIFLFLTLFYKWQLATSSYYLNCGNDNYNTENYNQALKDYKYAAIIDGDRNIIYAAKIKRAEIFYASGMFDEARKELFEAIKENKTGYEAYELLGGVDYAERKFDLAIDHYNQALQFSDNENIEIRIKIKKGKSLIAQNKMDLAQDVFGELHFENSGADNNEILYYLALLDFDKNISASDSGLPRRSLSLEDCDEQMRDSLQSSVERLQRGEEEVLQRSGIENSGTEVLKNKVEKIKRFISEYDESKNSDYNNIKIADLYNKINEPYLAINRTRIVLENKQDYRDAWIVSGEANFIIGDYKKSLKDFEKALVLDSHNPKIYFWMGSVYEKMGDDLKSKEFFEKYELP